jgi:hypothetical protein
MIDQAESSEPANTASANTESSKKYESKKGRKR